MINSKILEKWYTYTSIRIFCHMIFWIMICYLYYLATKRFSEKFIWVFVLKELIVSVTIFYSTSWLISKWIAKERIIPIVIYFIASYFWWLTVTYLVCDFLKASVSDNEQPIYSYLNYFVKDGFFVSARPSAYFLSEL